MATSILGRGVRVEVSRTFGTAKTVSTISNAKPGVATSTGHGLAAGAVGYFSSVEGMVTLEGQAARVASPDANTFALENINTTSAPAFSGSADFFPVTGWATVTEASSYKIGGGTGTKGDDTRLIDEVDQEVNLRLAAQSLEFGLKPFTVPSEGLALCEDAARAGSYLVFRITLRDGSTRVAYASPSLSDEDVSTGQLGSGSFSASVKGFVVRGGA